MRTGKKEVKVMYQKGSETMDIVFKDATPAGISLRNFGPSPFQ